METVSYVAEAGLYYIGDPCYVVRDEDWAKLLDQVNYFDDDEQFYKGYKIMCKSTAYGDGMYDAKTDRGELVGRLPVDSGTIGIMPLECIDVTPKEIMDKGLGVVVAFNNNVWVEVPMGASRMGRFVFGNISVDTKETEEEVGWDTEEDETE